MKDILKCLICKKTFKHLGSHIYHKHKMLARDYKERFELPYNLGLVTEDIRDKQKKANARNWEQNRKNLVVVGKKYQFKKGRTGQRRISMHEREKFMERILNVNIKHEIKLEKCPVCKMQYKHLDSHLCVKHKLLRVTSIW